MTVWDPILGVLHVVGALAAVLLLAVLGRRLAVLLRQPSVIGEIAAGLLVVPLIGAVAGEDTVSLVLPAPVVEVLHLVGTVGLVLFLVSIVHELGRKDGGLRARSVGWVTVGSLVPALGSGLLLGWWVLSTGDTELRGDAPRPAFLLFVAIAMAVTAVPVLARILVDRRLNGTPVGDLAMSAAVATDMVAWVLLAVAIGLTAGGVGGALVSMLVMAVGIPTALGCRALLRSGGASAWASRFVRSTSLLLALAALGTAVLLEHWGLTAVVGAFLVGLAVPGGGALGGWDGPVGRLATVGRALVPVFFVVAGLDLFSGPSSGFPLGTTVLAVVLGILGKVGGGYLGARLARLPRGEAATFAVLMNTRGLTEIVVLQAGYAAGILSAGLFLVLVAMALVTTAMTGPLLSLLASRRRPAEPATV
ncbi:cation:proton antiporter [Actinoalloteichus caeruleus]|uniref:Kef-type K+ transport system, membrane component KefB n=1 Tax=Actinoalloteichus caeruleus DSM 43889 TaxID=1120930 RepID=A0ABT1JEW0_ACTCY|nr:cation:proton antiporter [Actinoalloteichus caeruleus]MCP2330676.1 Kef-type K+ transport system, membrane component KefB [Actinoalloteichus caeruleus DSM 43889]